jgi:hypothetical protein
VIAFEIAAFSVSLSDEILLLFAKCSAVVKGAEFGSFDRRVYSVISTSILFLMNFAMLIPSRCSSRL